MLKSKSALIFSKRGIFSDSYVRADHFLNSRDEFLSKTKGQELERIRKRLNYGSSMGSQFDDLRKFSYFAENKDQTIFKNALKSKLRNRDQRTNLKAIWSLLDFCHYHNNFELAKEFENDLLKLTSSLSKTHTCSTLYLTILFRAQKYGEIIRLQDRIQNRDFDTIFMASAYKIGTEEMFVKALQRKYNPKNPFKSGRIVHILSLFAVQKEEFGIAMDILDPYRHSDLMKIPNTLTLNLKLWTLLQSQRKDEAQHYLEKVLSNSNYKKPMKLSAKLGLDFDMKKCNIVDETVEDLVFEPIQPPEFLHNKQFNLS